MGFGTVLKPGLPLRDVIPVLSPDCSLSSQCHCRVLAVLLVMCGESVSPRARLWWLLCPPTALTCGSGVQVPRGVSGGGTAQLSWWHCHAGVALPGTQHCLWCRVYQEREPVCPGACPALSPCPCHAGHSWQHGAVFGLPGCRGSGAELSPLCFQPGVMPWPLPAPAGPGPGRPVRSPRSL